MRLLGNNVLATQETAKSDLILPESLMKGDSTLFEVKFCGPKTKLKEGDKIIVNTSDAGFDVDIDGKAYRLFNDSYVKAVL